MKPINRQLSTLLAIATLAILLAGCESFSSKKNEQSNLPAATPNESPVESTPIETAVTPRVYDNIWERIRAGYGLQDASNEDIDTQLRFYTSNKAYFSRLTQDSEPYLYYVVTELEANNMPLELALLPFIESAYNPAAVSPGQNVGMWQIANITGKTFGLTQNNWYNGRKDVVASTDVAIKLLKRLYTLFDNDWLLAIAAYNAGEGTVQQAINKNKRANKPTDFWSLPLRKITQSYVPQLLAFSKVVGDPDRYGYKLYPIQDAPYFVKVNIDSQVNLVEAVQNTNINANQLKKLNAGLNGWLTDPTASHQLLVPVADAAAFTLQLETLPKLPLVKWIEHVVKKGDTLDAVAKKYGVNIPRIQTANNLKSTNLSIGQRLQIPLSPTSITPAVASALTAKVVGQQAPSQVANQSIKESANNNYYIVKSGESLWSIAKAQKLSVTTLAQMNKISPDSAIQPGQKLTVISEANQEDAKTE